MQEKPLNKYDKTTLTKNALLHTQEKPLNKHDKTAL